MAIRPFGGDSARTDALTFVRKNKPVCWNWQTRRTQNPLPAMACGFDPHYRHQQQVPCTQFRRKALFYYMLSHALRVNASRQIQQVSCGQFRRKALFYYMLSHALLVNASRHIQQVPCGQFRRKALFISGFNYATQNATRIIVIHYFIDFSLLIQNIYPKIRPFPLRFR